MTDAEKVEWAKRAFAEIVKECERIAALDPEIVSRSEARAWLAMAAIAKRNIKILEQ